MPCFCSGEEAEISDSGFSAEISVSQDIDLDVFYFSFKFLLLVLVFFFIFFDCSPFYCQPKCPGPDHDGIPVLGKEEGLETLFC